MPHLKFNVDAGKRLVQYEFRARRLSHGTTDRVAASQEIIAHSKILIAELDTLFAADAFQMGWLRPVGNDPPASPARGADEVVARFNQQLRVLREKRAAILAHLVAIPEIIAQSSALLTQIDEEIDRIECELGGLGAYRNRAHLLDPVAGMS